MSFVSYLPSIEYYDLDSVISAILMYIETYLELNAANTATDPDDVNNPAYVAVGACMAHILKMIPTVLVFIYRVYRIQVKIRELIIKIRMERLKNKNK